MKKTGIAIILAGMLAVTGCAGAQAEKQDEKVTLSMMMPQSNQPF